jgi:hypothetical protein
MTSSMIITGSTDKFTTLLISSCWKPFCATARSLAIITPAAAVTTYTQSHTHPPKSPPRPPSRLPSPRDPPPPQLLTMLARGLWCVMNV